MQCAVIQQIKKKVGWEKGNEKRKMMLCLSSESIRERYRETERERDQKKLNGVTFKWVGGSI